MMPTCRALALGGRVNEVVVEALVVRTSSRRDPLFGRRVVCLLFRIGRAYEREPVVLVDLTAERLMVDPAIPSAEMGRSSRGLGGRVRPHQCRHCVQTMLSSRHGTCERWTGQ